MGTVQGEHHEVFRIRLPVRRCLRCSPVQQPGLWLPPSLHLWSLRPLCCPCCPLCCHHAAVAAPAVYNTAVAAPVVYNTAAPVVRTAGYYANSGGAVHIVKREAEAEADADAAY